MKTKIQHIYATTLLVSSLFACNNYGVAAKLENSSGSSGSGSLTYYIFISSRTTAGNMSSLNNGGCTGGGMAQADCSCRDAAVAAGLNSGNVNYIAWLSSSASEMRCRITNGTGFGCAPSGGPTWYNTVGQPVFSGYNALFSGTLTSQILTTEFKQPFVAAANIWTGTSSNGAYATPACTSGSDWNNATSGASGTKGDVGANTGIWTANASVLCNTPLPVYCIAAP